MHRDPRPRSARPLALAACALVGLATGCAFWRGGAPPEPTLDDAEFAARMDARVGGAIEASLPEVSYRTDNPALTDPLGRSDPSRLVRRIETLDGEGEIVCLKRERRAFGECAFPDVVAP